MDRRKSMGSPTRKHQPLSPLSSPLKHQEEHFDAEARGLQILEGEEQVTAILEQLEAEVHDDFCNILSELTENEWMYTPQQYFQ